ncbi:MAG: Dam-replacing domain protein [Pirellulales bacterium]|nr:Dam-replacing domain protein [Pirellulales bacterium]
MSPELRGWTLNVFNFARTLRKDEFCLSEVYAFEDSLRSIYPGNNNIRPKIRQQLQLLRDAGILEFVAPGQYRFSN